MATWDYRTPSTSAPLPKLLDSADNHASSKDEMYEITKDNLVFVLDCTEKMWSVMPDGSVPLIEALETVQKCFRACAVAGSKDTISLVLFGTVKNSTGDRFHHLFQLYPDPEGKKLCPPSADIILDIGKIIKGGRTYFEARFGIEQEGFKYADMFWYVRTLLDPKKIRGTRRMILLTNQDSPHSSSNALFAEREKARRETTLTRIRDVMESGIEIALYGLNSPSHTFDYTRFYSFALGDTENEESTNELISFNTFKDNASLEMSLRKRIHAKRSIGSTFLFFSSNYAIPVKIYSLFTETKPRTSLADPVTLKPVVSQRKFFRTDNMEEIDMSIDDEELLENGENPMGEQQSSPSSSSPNKRKLKFDYGFNYGGKYIVFNQEEYEAMNNLFEPGIQLLGFRARSDLKVYHNIKHSLFIFPDDSNFSGASLSFRTLIESMHKLDKMAICRYQTRRGHIPRLAALLPQLESYDEQGNQVLPSGLNVIILPFSDDIRPFVQSENVLDEEHLNQNVCDAAKQIISEFKIKDYSPQNYLNPTLQQYFSVIEALALDLKEPEPFHDTTVPPIEKFEQHKELFEKLLSDKTVAIASSKPEKKAKTSAASAKVTKPKDLAEMTDAEISALIENDTIGKFKVAQLAEYLQSRGIKPLKKKDQLIEQLSDLFAK